VRQLAAEGIFSVNCICLQNKGTTTPTALRQHDDVTKSGHSVLMQRERFICCSCRRSDTKYFRQWATSYCKTFRGRRHLT